LKNFLDFFETRTSICYAIKFSTEWIDWLIDGLWVWWLNFMTDTMLLTEILLIYIHRICWLYCQYFGSLVLSVQSEWLGFWHLKIGLVALWTTQQNWCLYLFKEARPNEIGPSGLCTYPSFMECT
jgi:hypothetical protein